MAEMLEPDDHPLATAEARMATVTDEEFFAALGAVNLVDSASRHVVYGDDIIDARSTVRMVDPLPAPRKAASGYITSANVAMINRIVARMRADGVEVTFQTGWPSRSVAGSFGPGKGGLVHHDASSIKSGIWGSIGVIIAGRSDLEGPLSQFQIARGDVPRITVVTAGRANHAGSGGPYLSVPADSGNRWLYGAEVANDGVGEPYSAATLFTIESWGAAVAAETGGGVQYLLGHREYARKPSALDTATARVSSRKIDPTYNMNAMRQRIAAHKTGEQDMAQLDADDLKAIKAISDASNKWWLPRALSLALAGQGSAAYGPEDVTAWAGINLRSQLTPVETQVLSLAKSNAALTAQVAGLQTALQAVATTLTTGVDYGQLKSIIDTAVTEALASIELVVTPPKRLAADASDERGSLFDEEAGSVDPDAELARYLSADSEDTK